MGGVRYERAYRQVAEAQDRAAAIRALPHEGVVMALAAASREKDPLLANVLATEALNRIQRAHAIVENLAEGVLPVDASGRILHANPAAVRLLRDERDDLLGMPYHPRIHRRGDGSPMPPEECVVLRTLETGRELHRHEEGDAYLRRDGTLFPVGVSSAPVLRDGEVVGAVAIFRDLTQEKQAADASRRLASIVEHSADGIFSVDADGVVTQANAAAGRTYGVKAEDVVGRTLWSFQAPERHERTRRSLERVMQGEVLRFESTSTRPDGRVLHAATTAFPVKDGQGRVVGASAIVRDVTGRKEAEAERDRLHRALERRFHTVLPALSWGAGAAALLLVLSMLAAAVYPPNVHDHVLLAGVLLALAVGMAVGVQTYARRGHRFEGSSGASRPKDGDASRADARVGPR